MQESINFLSMKKSIAENAKRVNKDKMYLVMDESNTSEADTVAHNFRCRCYILRMSYDSVVGLHFSN